VKTGSQQTAVQRVRVGEISASSDILAVEEPLEIRVGHYEQGKGVHRALSITMRTPGADRELAAGFLFTEGIISSSDQIKEIRHCGPRIGAGKGTVDRSKALSSNTIRVDLNSDVELDLSALNRNFYTTSSCGVCGKSSIDALATAVKPLSTNDLAVPPELIRLLPNRLRTAQSIFDQTGGLHACALFSVNGELDVVREDVGRHNALDKIIGAKFLAGEIPLSDSVLLVSGRASFELVQKALMAGIPIMAAVGAPSSLAVDLAREFGMTLVGFVKDDSFNIYAGEQRVTTPK
jgi:FdhD protein